MMTNYFADMEIVDKRLKKLEKCYEEISKLLEGLSADISNITNGGSNGKQKVSSSTQSSNRTSRRTKSRDVNIDNK